MKLIKKFLSIVLAISFCSGVLTACDPDDIDAFAKGYRDGYYGTRSEVANTDLNEVETPVGYQEAE